MLSILGFITPVFCNCLYRFTMTEQPNSAASEPAPQSALLTPPVLSSGNASSQHTMTSVRWGTSSAKYSLARCPVYLPWHLLVLIGALVVLSILLALLFPRSPENAPGPIVIDCPTGVLLGIEAVAGDYGSVYAFLGISYAVAPERALRFRAPITKPREVKPVDAAKIKLPCVQAPSIHGPPVHELADSQQSEDCLHLNVWTPTLSCSGRGEKAACATKTILVLFFGQDFEYGGNDEPMTNGRFLSAIGDMVVVVPNYRHGPFGFLSTGNTQRAPGNVGLMDQVAAFEWTLRNAPSFGGNVSRIALAGYNDGAASVGYMLTGHASNVRRAVLLGATPFTRFFENTINPLLNAKHLAQELCCERWNSCLARGNTSFEASPDDIIDCLRDVPARDLSNQAAVRVQLSWKGFGPTFSRDPVLEDPFVHVGYAAPTGVHILLGITADVDRPQELLHFLGKFLEKQYGFWCGSGIVKHFLRSHGDQPNPISEGFLKELLSCVFYICPMQYYRDALQKRQSRSSIYVFWPKLSYRVSSISSAKAATRLEDLGYFMGDVLKGSHGASTEERALGLRLVRALASFVANGTLPPVEGQPWPTGNGERSTVHIHLDTLTLGSLPGSNHCDALYRHVTGHPSPLLEIY
ncbi:acetylcholinesterase-1-like isoform X3 [Ornithodoros turicata]|uniref:acetylcholinesterase-1-like isoform X3 n=1 Tax=Ornithodoros turicata TaxID=34597 RepID=UPI003139D5BF